MWELTKSKTSKPVFGGIGDLKKMVTKPVPKKPVKPIAVKPIAVKPIGVKKLLTVVKPLSSKSSNDSVMK